MNLVAHVSLSPAPKPSFEECVREALLEQRARHGLSPVERLQRRFERAARLAIIQIALDQVLEATDYHIKIHHCEEHGLLRDLEVIMDIIGNFADDEVLVFVYPTDKATSKACGFIHFMLCNDLTEVLGDWDLSLEKHITRALKISGYQSST